MLRSSLSELHSALLEKHKTRPEVSLVEDKSTGSDSFDIMPWMTPYSGRSPSPASIHFTDFDRVSDLFLQHPKSYPAIIPFEDPQAVAEVILDSKRSPLDAIVE